MRRASCAAAVVVAAASLVVGTVVGARPASAASETGWRSLSYGTEHLKVPSRWPVFDLERAPATCVRFNRHAVYLGAASQAGGCPAHAMGVAAALELSPLRDEQSLVIADRLEPVRLHGQAALLSTMTTVTHRLVAVFPRDGVVATISYRTNLMLAKKIFASFHPGVGSLLNRAARARATPEAMRQVPSPRLVQDAPHIPQAGTSLGVNVYKGEGFDTCEAPDEQQMASWKRYSPYGAIGVYIGGINAACTNITSSWVSNETAAGWSIWPIYVGLQSPCVSQQGLALLSINPARAAREGAAAAKDAVAHAESFGMGPGTTITFDMEDWDSEDGSCNRAVNSFIAGWTRQLHAAQYHSGIYGSLGSGIAPGVVSMWGKKGAPHVLWFAHWDGVPTTLTDAFPQSYWPHDQRMKQYAGNLWQSFGGVQIEVDPDYLDAPTITRVGPMVTAVEPATAPVGARVTILGTDFVPGHTTVHFGKTLGINPDVVTPEKLTVTVPPQSAATASVTVTTPQGTSPPDPDPSLHYSPFDSIAADQTTGVYWMATTRGNVDNFGGEWYGSAAGHRLAAPVVGIARTKTGYLVATAAGNVYNFNTPFYGSMAHKKLPSPVVGIAATATGYLLVAAGGEVYNFHTPWFGSRAGKHLSSPVVGIAATETGYLLTTSRGNVYSFDTAWYGSRAGKNLSSRVVGIATTSTGYLLATSGGNVYNYNTPWWGSKAGAKLPAPISSITTTSTGYLLSTTAGQLYAYNTASYGSPAGKAG